MSRVSVLASAGRWSFPRVSGDEPFGFTVPLRWDPFSPRERG